MGSSQDVELGDERAAAPELGPLGTVQKDGRHPRPLARPGLVPSDHPERREGSFPALWGMNNIG
jgi:hypothetical protein